MAKKSRRRKFEAKRPPGAPAGKTVALAPATHKPWQIAAVCIVLVVVTVFSFRGVRNNGFVSLDDNEYVVHNRQVQQGVTAQSVEWAFTTFNSANWHPLTWISHMVDWKLYGGNPSGQHMTNVCWHAANSVLLFLLLLYMTGFIWRSAIVAFLFALHPAHVESVAWISERKDVLCAFFFFATLLAYAWYVRRPSWKRYVLIVFGFACALMSKPMAVTLPFTLLLLDYWPLHRIAFAPETHSRRSSSLSKLCVEKWPLFLMAVLSSVITFLAQRAQGAVATFQNMPLWGRLCNAAISYYRYVRIMVWPDPLRAYYYLDLHNIGVLAAVLSAIAIFLVTAACWRIRKERPYCLIGWLWFLGTLVPVIGIVQVGGQALAERYTYIPYIGLFIAVVWLAGDAVANSPKIKAVALLLAAAVIVACAVKTDAQVKVWKDTETLFGHVLEVDPRGELPNLSLGIAYMKQGRLADAQKYYDRALSYNPSWYLTLSYSAYCLMISCEPNERPNLPLAGQRLETALRAAPDSPDVLSVMALWSYMMGRTKDEETYSEMAIAANPDFVPARLYLAYALQTQGKLDQAVEQYRQAIAIQPDNYDAHNDLGVILGKQGLTEEALKELRHSLAIKPDQAAPHFYMGKIFMRAQRFSEAVEEYTQAVRFDPANANAHNELGAALFQLGDYEKAAAQFSEALRIDPSHVYARKNLDLVQARMKSKSVEQGRK
ncbi:MAG: tetratricopeptide repeat protein [Terracidiphilus sp.]|jgi:tetratricopeptide (TPR) repeat protein